MQDVIPLKVEPREQKMNAFKNLVDSGLSFLCWASPFIGLNIFFPMGVLVLYPRNQKLRIAAFQSLVLQIFINLVVYPMDLYAMYSFETESLVIALKEEYFGVILLSWSFFGLFLLFLEARYLIHKKGEIHLFNQKPPKEFRDLHVENSFSRTFVTVVVVWIIAIVWFCMLSYLFVMINTKDNDFEQTMSIADQMFRGESSLYLWFMTLLSASSLFGRKGILSILRRPYISLYLHTKLSANPTSDFLSKSFFKKRKYARVRELILPGWGHIYLQRNWKGFPILFTYLLLFFFFAISITFYMDTVFGIKFLTSFGLKAGIPDKEFLEYTDNPAYPVALFLILTTVYIAANSMLGSALKRDDEQFKERGLQTGFTNNVYLSVLAHLLLFAIIFIIPISLQRQGSKKKQDISKNHYQPEKMEYYFIDPEIPDEVKDLNGGVISGTETPSQKDGIKIPNNPVQDEGKVKGYVKRIKGKKLPRTYSNYISARMRGPENFMEYWKRAPHPYSCVVAYTITTEGEIIDVILVESSAYPDQDNLTLDLIRSMSPVMPPPNVKGDVRVTELFWNGSIDPDAMPTPLQKDMVLHFDGRYMEEEF